MESLLIPTNWQRTCLNNGTELVITFVTTPASLCVSDVSSWFIWMMGGRWRGGGVV